MNTQIKEMVESFANQLHEHCDSVRIFVTFPSNDGEANTHAYETGKGNFYAQLGQVIEWVTLQEQFQRNFADRKDQEGR